MNEVELIQSLRNGDEAAFKFLVKNYQDRVYNTAIGIVQNAEDAQDVAQEVFIQVFRSIHSFKEESKLSTWIYRITTSRALDLLRSRKSKKRFGFLQRLFGDSNETLYELPDFNHPGIALDR
ncbi:MAG TPA: sigma-70 family RNA polymerase sigma factor, partial [Chitinophagaceae bacterium]|nr:sigma-70 family RNA polymerase sigma factor [Chitinophagaceae bacterium]